MSDTQVVTPSDNRDALLLGISWSWATISVTTVAMRLYVRHHYLHKIWWDDWWILLTTSLMLGFTILWTYLCHIKGTHHMSTLQPAEISHILKINWISQCFCVTSLATSKASVASLIMRIQSRSTWRTTVLWACSTLSLVYGAIMVILVWCQCQPITKLWFPTIPGECWPSDVITGNAMAVSSVWATTDLILAVLPIHMIWQVHLPLRRKILLSGCLGVGIFACACAIAKIIALKSENARSDFTWETAPLFVWNANEVNVVIIAACIPTLRPLLVVLFKRPGFEEYKRKKHSYHIEEAREVTVELSTRKNYSKGPYANTAAYKGHNHSDDGDSNRIIFGSKSAAMGPGDKDSEGKGSEEGDYSYHAWAGSGAKAVPPRK